MMIDYYHQEKLWADAFLMQKKKMFKNALNKIGPTIEPCGTPKSVFEVTANIVDMNTLLTVFQVCKNI